MKRTSFVAVMLAAALLNVGGTYYMISGSGGLELVVGVTLNVLLCGVATSRDWRNGAIVVGAVLIGNAVALGAVSDRYAGDFVVPFLMSCGALLGLVAGVIVTRVRRRVAG